MLAVDRADCTGPIRQHELLCRSYKIGARPALKDLDHQVGTDHTDDVSEGQKCLEDVY